MSQRASGHLEFNPKSLAVLGRGDLRMGQGDSPNGGHALRAAQQAKAGARCRTAAHLQIHGTDGLTGRVFDSAALDHSHRHKHE